MSGKPIGKLTLTEIRAECASRGLSTTGTKADLELRLAGLLVKQNLVPANVRFFPTTQPDTPVTNVGPIAPTPGPTEHNDTDITYDQTGAGSPMGHHVTRDQRDPFSYADEKETALPPPSVTFTADIAQHPREQVPVARQIEAGLDQRLTNLESRITSFLDDQSQLAECMRRLEKCFTRQQQEPTADTTRNRQPSGHDQSYTHRARDDQSQVGGIRRLASPERTRINRTHRDDAYAQSLRAEAHRIPIVDDSHHEDRVFGFDDDTDAPYDVTTGIDPRVGHPAYYSARRDRQSLPRPLFCETARPVLIPYEDLRTARTSLTEFYGKKEEDPVRYLQNTESILEQAKIHPSSWTRAIEPQLKGIASAWWQTIKALDLSWSEFRTEFLEKFDNPKIQSRLRAEIVSVRQSPNQTLTEFVLDKNQLARRINTGLTEPQLVGIIAGLMRDEFRTHVRLQAPSTLSELRRIAGVLDPRTHVTPNSVSPVTRSDKNTAFSRPNDRNSRSYRRPPDGRKPPGPCRYCGGDHWNSNCEHNPNVSGNGGGADRT